MSNASDGQNIGRDGLSVTADFAVGSREVKPTIDDIGPVLDPDCVTPAQGLPVVRDSAVFRAARASHSGILRHLGVESLSAQAAEDFRRILAGLRQVTRLDGCLPFPSIEAMTHRVDVEVDPGAAKILFTAKFWLGSKRVEVRKELFLIDGSASNTDWQCDDEDVDLSSLNAITVDWLLSKVREKLFPSK